MKCNIKDIIELREYLMNNAANMQKAYVEANTDKKTKVYKDGTWVYTAEGNVVNTLEMMYVRQYNKPENEKYKPNMDWFEKFDFVTEYVKNNNMAYVVDYHDYGLYLLRTGEFLIVAPEKMVEVIEEKDYSDIPVALLRERTQAKSISGNLPADVSNESINSAREKQDEILSTLEKLKQEEEDIENAKCKELAELSREMEKIKAELEVKKKNMLAVLEEKKAQLEAERTKMERNIYMLETEIYSIRCLMGETFDVNKVRSGKRAATNEPLVINQKMLYLDEDLARLSSIYAVEISENLSILEDVLKYNDGVVDGFNPQEKSITFFRLSRTGETQKTGYKFADNEFYKVCKSYGLLHGKKIGFTIRNGEELYVGWMDDEWKDETKLTFNEEVLYKPKTEEMQIQDDKEERYLSKWDIEKLEKENQRKINERVSRLFALTVVQGIVNDGRIISIPDKFSMDSPYIVINYADAWLDDNRYGDFNTLMNSLRYFNKVGDDILVVESAREEKCGTYENYRGNSSTNRTRDCSVNAGINKINFIDDKGNIYVSALKRYSECGSRSNFMLDKSEYYNLTYINSEWMKYYIQTKKIGDKYSQYSDIVIHFKRSLDFIKNRECEERKAIEKYVDLSSYSDWMVNLSYWKITNGVRNITDYQAKRFAKYLCSNKLYELPNLFLEFDDDREWISTVFCGSKLPGARNTSVIFNKRCKEYDKTYAEDSEMSKKFSKLVWEKFHFDERQVSSSDEIREYIAWEKEKTEKAVEWTVNYLESRNLKYEDVINELLKTENSLFRWYYEEQVIGLSLKEYALIPENKRIEIARRFNNWEESLPDVTLCREGYYYAFIYHRLKDICNVANEMIFDNWLVCKSWVKRRINKDMPGSS